MSNYKPLQTNRGKKEKEIDQTAPTLFFNWVLAKFEFVIASEVNRLFDELEKRWPRK